MFIHQRYNMYKAYITKSMYIALYSTTQPVTELWTFNANCHKNLPQRSRVHVLQQGNGLNIAMLAVLNFRPSLFLRLPYYALIHSSHILYISKGVTFPICQYIICTCSPYCMTQQWVYICVYHDYISISIFDTILVYLYSVYTIR